MPYTRQEKLLDAQGTTDDYVYSPSINTADYSETVAALHCTEGVSGVLYTIRGYTTADAPSAYSIASGSLVSGDYVRIHSGLCLNNTIRVGIASECAGESGAITCFTLQRGRAA